MKTALLSLALLAAPSPALAQPVCQTFTIPSQGEGLGPGRAWLDPVFPIPGATADGVGTVYMIDIANIDSARLSAVTWSHQFPAGYPKDSILAWGVTITRDGRVILSNPHGNLGDDRDGAFVSFNLSHPIVQGERYAVGLFNANLEPVTIRFLLTLQECR